VTFAPGRRRARLAGRSFHEIVTKLRECRVSAFPVLDADGKAIGVVSEADLLLKEAVADKPNVVWGLLACIVHHAVQAKAGAVTAADLMTSPAVTIGPGEKVEHAARLMYDRKVKRLPVVDRAGRHARDRRHRPRPGPAGPARPGRGSRARPPRIPGSSRCQPDRPLC
jgi:CBS domain-containing protein